MHKMCIMTQTFLLTASQWTLHCSWSTIADWADGPPKKVNRVLPLSGNSIVYMYTHTVSFPFPSYVLGKMSLLHWLSEFREEKRIPKWRRRTRMNRCPVFTVKCDCEWWRCRCTTIYVSRKLAWLVAGICDEAWKVENGDGCWNSRKRIKTQG